MHTEPRLGPIDKIVVHTNEGPERTGGARNLVAYLQTIQGGYHVVVDDRDTIVTATDNLVVWGATGMNERGLHICLVGYAAQSAQEWADPYSHSEILNAVDVVAGWCQKYQIPARHLTVLEVGTSGAKGICGHADVSKAFNGTHTDPGPNFPWPAFVALVQQKLIPAPPAPPKVAFMYDPPLIIPGGIRASMKWRGGELLANEAGEFYAFDCPWPGNLDGKSYWGVRRLARLDPAGFLNREVRATATTGEAYTTVNGAWPV